MDPNAATKQLTPADLANQLFDAALVQYKSDPREAAQQVIVFLTEAVVYVISSVAGKDDEARKAALKDVGEAIVAAPPHPLVSIAPRK